MNKNEAKIISSCPLFSGISVDEVMEIFNNVSFSTKHYAKDSLVMIRGDQYDSLKILLEGEVSAEIQDFTGKTIKIENLKAPDAIALGILFADDNTLPVTIVARSNVKVISIPKDSIIKIAQKNKQFLNYFTGSGNKVVFLVEKLRLLKFKSLRQKFSGYILSLSAKQNSETVQLPYNREELAELFGVARPSLSRICSELSDEGLLRLEGKNITILDKKKLKESLS
jgi:CRP-like cAMP-binding protein